MKKFDHPQFSGGRDMCWLQRLDYSSENSTVFLWILRRSPQSNQSQILTQKFSFFFVVLKTHWFANQTRQTLVLWPKLRLGFLFLRQSCFSSSDSHFNFTCQGLKLDLSHMMIYWNINLYRISHTHTIHTHVHTYINIPAKWFQKRTIKSHSYESKKKCLLLAHLILKGTTEQYTRT